MKKLTSADLTTLSQQARQSPRLRANSNLHRELTDPIQRLAIAMEPDTLILPHRHPHTWEVLTALRGRFTVLVFDDAGRVIERAVLGEDTGVVEIPAGALACRAVARYGCGDLRGEARPLRADCRSGCCGLEQGAYRRRIECVVRRGAGGRRDRLMKCRVRLPTRCGIRCARTCPPYAIIFLLRNVSMISGITPESSMVEGTVYACAVDDVASRSCAASCRNASWADGQGPPCPCSR